jgi:hypothetical protein
VDAVWPPPQPAAKINTTTMKAERPTGFGNQEK